MRYQLTRDVTVTECPWLKRGMRKGEIVYRYDGPTYGCVTHTGTACSRNGQTPFFELPTDALRTYYIQVRDNLRMWDPLYERERVMQHDDLYAALGLDPRKKLPDSGFLETMVGNVLVWVLPKIPGKPQDAARTWCQCPRCARQLTAGKLQQHLAACKEPEQKLRSDTRDYGQDLSNN